MLILLLSIVLCALAHPDDGFGLAGVERFLARMRGVIQVGPCEWLFHCFMPDHPDLNQSARLTVRYTWYGRLAVFVSCHCVDALFNMIPEHVGMRRGELYDGLEAYTAAASSANARRWPTRRRADRPRVPPRPLGASDLAHVDVCHQRLLAMPHLQELLHRTRGLTLQAIRRHRIGWNGSRFTYPIYENGALVFVRLYYPYFKRDLSAGRRPRYPKWWGPPGSQTCLYPDIATLAVETRPWMIMFEGEHDALLAALLGLPAWTMTSGANSKPWPELIERLRGRRIVICYDCDVAGRREAKKLASTLRDAGLDVLDVDLGLGDKEDFTDYVLKYGGTKGTFMALIRQAARHAS